MRVGVSQSEVKRSGSWLLPAVFAAFAAAAFTRPYVVRAIRYGIDAMLRNIVEVETYNRTVIASNYFDDGFVRRGLGGTIAVLLSRDWDRSIWLFIAVSFVALAVPLVLIIRRLTARLGTVQTLYLGLVLALSPQTFFGWAHDPCRTDLLIAACLAFSMLAWLRGMRAIAVAVILLGLLTHETAVTYGMPLLAAMAIIDLRSGALGRAEAIRLALAAVVGVAIIFALQMAFSASSAVTARNMLAQAPTLADDPEHRLWRDIAIYMAVEGPRALKTALCYNMHMAPRYWPQFFGCLAVLAIYALILPLRRHFLIAVLVMWVPTIFMMVVANDTGRWLKLGVFDGWLLTSFLLLRGEAAGLLSRRAMAIGAVLFVGLMTMGPTRYNNVNGAYGQLLLRLGYQDHAALDVWMNSCDPDWRRTVYGSFDRRPAVSVI